MLSADLIPTDPDTPRMVRQRTLAHWFGVAESTIQRWAVQGILPAPIRLGPRTKYFHVEKLRAWLRRRERDAAEEDMRNRQLQACS